ncbi:MAG: GAF domain-containing protein [Epsilonproteobacteria bacterium]|nr:GAF domain-containing protein [Campylobacterota bacterium]
MAQEIDKRKLNKLLELNKKIVAENDFSKRIKLISDSIKEILKVDRCTIFIHDENSKSLWSVYIDGVSYIEVPDDKGIASEVYERKKSIVINDAHNDKHFNAQVDEGTGYKTKSILAIPIIGYGGKVLGVMQLINKIDGTDGFSDEDEKILGYVMGHISAYLEILDQEK